MKDNPFSTRYIRPGAQPYCFASGVDAQCMVDQLRNANWHGEIVGPHGAGKSTMLVSLIPVMEEGGREVVSVVLHDGERSLPAELRQRDDWNTQTQIIVDGYEQLGRLARWRLGRAVKRCGGGLLVTSHETVGLPPLAALNPTLDDAVAVVRRLIGETNGAISRDQIAKVFGDCHGNIRETLFCLYDLYERENS